MTAPLEHIRVLDLSRILAGPWATQILADLGADVIKVERPRVGDDTRSWGPPFLKDSQGNDTREAGYFLAANRGKRSITLDLSKPEGQRVVRQLAAVCDVVIENYKVGTLAGFGLGYEDLRAINPRLVYCSVTGFGQNGPRAEQAAYDFMIQAMGGLMSVTGERDDLPGGGPQKVGVPIVDLMTGLYAACAIQAALLRRNETGNGDYIDIGMLDVMVGSLANQGMNYLISGRAPKRGGNRHPNIQPQDVFACNDGYVVIVVGNDLQFEKFCQAIERPDLSADPRFKTNGGRVRHLDELLPVIQDVLQQRSMKQWSEAFDRVGVPCSAINTVPDVFADPQVVHRNMLTRVPHPLAGEVPQIQSPMRFREGQISERRAPPLLGQHTNEILAQLGWSEDGVKDLAARGVI